VAEGDRQEEITPAYGIVGTPRPKEAEESAPARLLAPLDPVFLRIHKGRRRQANPATRAMVMKCGLLFADRAIKRMFSSQHLAISRLVKSWGSSLLLAFIQFLAYFLQVFPNVPVLFDT
jgi:hypothetical protein